MKKNLINAILCVLFCNQLFGQTELANHEKYWTYRDNLKRKYLKIGNIDNVGNLLFGASIPIENRDNVNTGCGGTGNRMRWGDATLHQGYYIAMLATEYQLLFNSAKDVTGTLNELYYAIAAVKRLDDFAEDILNNISPSSANTNGFLIRDDVDGQFSNNWIDPPDNVTCISSCRYDTENGTASNNFFNPENEMSQDQVYGLLLGFSFVKKFIPAGLIVRPTPQDPPLNLVGEVQAITNNIMNYVSSPWTENISSPLSTGCSTQYVTFLKNWTIRNPITEENVSRGANMDLFAPYCTDQVNMITGNSYNPSVSYGITFPGFYPACLNNSSITYSASFSLSFIRNAWNNLQNLNWSDFVITLNNIPKFSKTSGLGYYNKTYDMMDETNRQMMLSLVSCTNSWTKTNIGRLAWDANMGIFDLVRSQLHGGGTWASQTDFQNELNSAPCDGPSSTTPNNITPWHTTNRWWKPTGAAVYGEFNGIDYMLLYNLYMLEFGNTIANVTYENVTCPCSNIAKKIDPYISGSILTQPVLLGRKFPEYLNFNISVPEFLTQSLTINTSNNLTLHTELIVCNNSILKTWTSNSLVLGTPSGLQDETGVLRVRSGSQYWLESNGEAILYPYSKIIIEKGGTFILRDNAKLIINDHAQVILEPGSGFTWGNGTQIIMQGPNSLFDIQTNPVINVNAGEVFHISKGTATQGGVVNIHDGTFYLNSYGKLNIADATLQFTVSSLLNYQFKSDIQLAGDHATLSLQSIIHLDDNAEFTFGYTGFNSGKVQLGTMFLTADQHCQFNLTGQGKTDVIVEIGGTANIADNLDFFSIQQGTINGISLNGNTRILSTGSPSLIRNCIGSNYDAIHFFGQNVHIENSEFENDNIAIGDYQTGSNHTNPVIGGCQFTNCGTPVFTYGLGVTMLSGNVHNNTDGGWAGYGMSYHSQINNTEFTDNSITGTGIQIEYSAMPQAMISIYKSNIHNTTNNGNAGIAGSGGILTMKCSAISGNQMPGQVPPSSGIKMNDHGIVNLSTDYGGGYNDLSENTSLIALNNSFAAINFGANNFAIYQPTKCLSQGLNCNPYIHGTVSNLSCNGFQQNFPADHNSWDASSTYSPNTTAFLLEKHPLNSCTDKVSYDDFSPNTPLSCPISGGGGGGIAGINRNPMVSGINVSLINTQHFQNIKLNTAVNNCIGLMDTGVVNGYKTAANRLTEILNYPLVNATDEDKEIQGIAYHRLLETMSEASYYGQLPDSMTTEHTNVINLQGNIITAAKLKSNDDEQFYTTMHQAGMYHLGGNLQQAIQLLNNVLAWASPENKDYAEEWLCYYQSENELKAGRMGREAFAATVQLCHHHGVPRIGTPEQLLTSSVNETKQLIKIFPNPNNGSFTIKLNNKNISTLEIYNSTGQLVYKTAPKDKQEMALHLSQFNKGIYLLKAFTGEGAMQLEKTVIY